MMEMLALTGTLGGVRLGGFRVGGVRLSVTGILIVTFFDPTEASLFIERRQSEYKVIHFWKKCYILPWVIDVSSRAVHPHNGIPILVGSIISSKRLQERLFTELS
jgi:hypothetical protein